jgi:epidermal growth factor receptor substrate 15
MRKVITALAVAVVACLLAAATAVADPGPIQVSGQSADTQQQAAAASSTTQSNPSNTNISIRVLSPGSDGSVTQSNTADSTATAGNAASTTQNADQSAGGSGVQTSQQSAGTDQLATALSAADQQNPSNTNIPIRVLSPGSDGDVTQSNSAGSSAAAGNVAGTTQGSSQTQAGSSCSCGGSSSAPSGAQSSDQQAQTDQASLAGSEAKQIDPSNIAVSIRVLSPGSNGDVTQSNDASSSALSGNAADTTQTSDQTQGGTTPVWSGQDCQCTSGSPIQTAKQDASTEQGSAALSGAVQKDPSNTASPVRVLSPGSDGSVDQSNDATSSATSVNAASTTQSVSQDPTGSHCGCSSSPIQVADQQAETAQSSAALSSALQSFGNKHGDCGCNNGSSGNTASPVRVYSPGSGGDVSQSNDASSSATSGNLATTTQDGTQSADSGSPIQVLDQQAGTEQESLAGSLAAQAGASNDASPVQVWSPGSEGSVDQSNDATSSATSVNAASTTQTGSQDPTGSYCGCGGAPIQVLGQKADTQQSSAALSAALQVFGDKHEGCGCADNSGNTASPVRVYSPGSGGDVMQSNDATSTAASGNLASTAQDATQTAGGGGLTIQALGQQAETGQGSLAASLAAQFSPSNNASPVRVLSPGGGGSVTHANNAASSAGAVNAARTDQTGRQNITGGRCSCEQLPIQVAGQWAGTAQLAPAFSAALQLDANNDSAPTSVKSHGADGQLAQTNGSTSDGLAGNGASSTQGVEQTT